MHFQINNELIFGVLENEIERMKTLIKTEMETVVETKVPLLVEVGVGKNWLEAH